jgi:phosphoglycolate phosphatase-like HAD superfamily hydrolase
MAIFFDLDGPILDVSEKYYKVYSDILSQNGFKVLSKSEYWNAKREKVSDLEILQRSMAEPFFERYQHQRKLLIESDPYLIYDKVQDCAVQVLDTLSKSNDLILVTLRTFPEQLHKQLERLDIRKYFVNVLSSDEETKPRWKIKYNLIRGFLGKKKTYGSILIGDTETDILAGKELGFVTIAVLNGIRSYRILKEANPTYILKSFKEILEINF